MKNYFLLTIALSLFIAAAGQAQKNQVTGPKAKNPHHWKNSKIGSIVMVKNHDHPPITGPKSRQIKPWEDACESYPLVYSKREILTGPEAKNKKFKSNLLNRPTDSAYFLISKQSFRRF